MKKPATNKYGQQQVPNTFFAEDSPTEWELDNGGKVEEKNGEIFLSIEEGCGYKIEYLTKFDLIEMLKLLEAQ